MSVAVCRRRRAALRGRGPPGRGTRRPTRPVRDGRRPRGRGRAAGARASGPEAAADAPVLVSSGSASTGTWAAEPAPSTAPPVDAEVGWSRARVREQQAREAGGGEPGAQGRGELEAGRGEGGEHAAPARGPQRGRLLGRDPEVARADRGRQLGQGGRDRAQVAMEVGALGARGDELGRGREVGPGRVARGIGGDQLRVVGGVVGDVRHVPALTVAAPARFPQASGRSAASDRAGGEPQHEERDADQQQGCRDEHPGRRARRSGGRRGGDRRGVGRACGAGTAPAAISRPGLTARLRACRSPAVGIRARPEGRSRGLDVGVPVGLAGRRRRGCRRRGRGRRAPVRERGRRPAVRLRPAPRRRPTRRRPRRPSSPTTPPRSAPRHRCRPRGRLEPARVREQQAGEAGGGEAGAQGRGEREAGRPRRRRARRASRRAAARPPARA